MTRDLAFIGIFCSSLASLAFPVHAQDVEKKPDAVALAAAGQASSKRFQKEAASWTSTTLAGGVDVVVESISAPDAMRWVLSFSMQGRRDEFARITQKDGVWFVKEGRKTGKYRPFEAPFDLSTAYVFLVRSEPQFITAAGQAALGTYQATRNGIATYRTPLPDAQAKQLENTMAAFDKFMKENPSQVVPPEAARKIDACARPTQERAIDRG